MHHDEAPQIKDRLNFPFKRVANTRIDRDQCCIAIEFRQNQPQPVTKQLLKT
jgi:hypothetical protein